SLAHLDQQLSSLEADARVLIVERLKKARRSLGSLRIPTNRLVGAQRCEPAAKRKRNDNAEKQFSAHKEISAPDIRISWPVSSSEPPTLGGCRIFPCDRI